MWSQMIVRSVYNSVQSVLTLTSCTQRGSASLKATAGTGASCGINASSDKHARTYNMSIAFSAVAR